MIVYFNFRHCHVQWFAKSHILFDSAKLRGAVAGRVYSEKRSGAGERAAGTGDVLQGLILEAHFKDGIFGGHTLLTFEHAVLGTVMKRARDQLPVQDLQQVALAVHADGINVGSAVGGNRGSTMAAMGL